MGALIIGTLAAAVAWGIFTLLPETWRPARIPVTIVAALMGALNGWSHVDSNRTTTSFEQELLQSRDMGELAQAWKEADPEGFDAFVREGLSARNEGNAGEVIDAIRPRLTAALTQRLHRLSDTDIVAIERNTREALLLFAHENPRFCHAMVTGVPLNLAADEARAAESAMRTLSQRRMELFVAAFRADPAAPIDAMSGAELEQALTDVRARTAAVVGEADLALIQTTSAPALDQQPRYCEVMAEFELQLSESPDAGRLYRGILLSQTPPPEQQQ